MILAQLLSDKDKFIKIIKDDWLSCKECFPDFLSEISEQTKSENENQLDHMINVLQAQLKKSHRFPITKKHWRRVTFQRITDALLKDEILGIRYYMNEKDINSFIEELKQFMKTLRSFSPELTFAEVGQATRNYIVYAMFKKIHKLDTGYSPAAFGYSMLYPYTDNYIDSDNLSDQEKNEYNRLIHDKLEGKSTNPTNMHQQKTCDLLDYIENEYPKDTFPYVSKLLLMMLDAQELSLNQQNKELFLTLQDRLDISIYKGGISVLMDRILVNKELSKEDLLFYLGFGLFLQLADDLQDIGEDLAQGHSNLFTYDLDHHQEEKEVNRLFHYLHDITTKYHTDNDYFKDFLQKSSYLLITTSVLRSRRFFSEEYLLRLETFLPVRSSYLEKLLSTRIEVSDTQTQNKYMSLIDELIK